MYTDNAKKIIELEADSVRLLADRLTDDFNKAVNAIIECDGRIVVSGMGKSGIIGKKISATLASTGSPSFFMHPAEAIHGDLGMLKKEDVLLAISNSGETEELIKMIPFAKSHNIRIIAICGNTNSYLADNCDFLLDSGVKREAGKIGLPPTCSTTAQLVMGDALAITVSELRNFEASDFANLHPGGSLGRKLIGSIKEVMITGFAVPIINENSTLIDAVKEITDKRLGFTTIVNNSRKLTGLLTDGDLRRIILRNKNKDIWNLNLRDVMTRHPLTVSRDIMVADALELMEKKQITSVIVANDDEFIEGVAHLHDLLGRGSIKLSMK
jgi:arabinose-5-phosphate isomerase